jgi:hypothetical protein
VRENVPNVHLAPIEVYHGNEPIFVATDVEYNPVTNLVGGWESSP